MAAVACIFCLTLLLLVFQLEAADDTITLTDSDGLGRVFDGIGGLSGGGVSKLN